MEFKIDPGTLGPILANKEASALLGALAANPAIIELILKLIEKFMNKPVPAPEPPPIYVPTPPPIPPPYPPARPLEDSINAGITKVYHDWFRGDEDQGVRPGDSTPEETDKVRRGILPCPSLSRIHISADPMPLGCIEEPFPAFHVTLKDEVTGVESTTILTKENPQPEDKPFQIQGGQTETSIYMRSTGHYFILICPEVQNRSSIRMQFVTSSGVKSNVFGVPWFAKR